MKMTYKAMLSVAALALLTAPALANETKVDPFVEYMDYDVKFSGVPDELNLNYRGAGVELTGRYDFGLAVDGRITSGNFYDFSMSAINAPIALSTERASLRMAYHFPGFGIGPAVGYEYGNLFGFDGNVVMAGVSADAPIGENVRLYGHLMGDVDKLDAFYKGAFGGSYSISESVDLNAEVNHIESVGAHMTGYEVGASYAIKDGVRLHGNVIYHDGGADLGITKASIDGLGVRAGVSFNF